MIHNYRFSETLVIICRWRKRHNELNARLGFQVRGPVLNSSNFVPVALWNWFESSSTRQRWHEQPYFHNWEQFDRRAIFQLRMTSWTPNGCGDFHLNLHRHQQYALRSPKLFIPKFKKCILPTFFLKRIGVYYHRLSSEQAMKSQALHTVWNEYFCMVRLQRKFEIDHSWIEG